VLNLAVAEKYWGEIKYGLDCGLHKMKCIFNKSTFSLLIHHHPSIHFELVPNPNHSPIPPCPNINSHIIFILKYFRQKNQTAVGFIVEWGKILVWVWDDWRGRGVI